jgi:hypothetical protein
MFTSCMHNYGSHVQYAECGPGKQDCMVDWIHMLYCDLLNMIVYYSIYLSIYKPTPKRPTLSPLS